MNWTLPVLAEQKEGGEYEEVRAVEDGRMEDLLDDQEVHAGDDLDVHAGDDLDVGGDDADDDASGAAYGEKQEEDGDDDVKAAEEAEEAAYHPEVEHTHGWKWCLGLVVLALETLPLEEEA